MEWKGDKDGAALEVGRYSLVLIRNGKSVQMEFANDDQWFELQSDNIEDAKVEAEEWLREELASMLNELGEQ